MVDWLAALVVTAVYAAIADALALQGRNKVREAAPPAVPEQHATHGLRLTDGSAEK